MFNEIASFFLKLMQYIIKRLTRLRFTVIRLYWIIHLNSFIEKTKNSLHVVSVTAKSFLLKFLGYVSREVRRRSRSDHDHPVNGREGEERAAL